MLSFEMRYDEWPDIRVLKQGFEKWMSAIEINADKYTTNILSGFYEIPNLGRLEVSYEGRKLFYVNFYNKYHSTEKGKKSICGMFTVNCADDGKELTNPDEKIV